MRFDFEHKIKERRAVSILNIHHRLRSMHKNKNNNNNPENDHQITEKDIQLDGVRVLE
jgi:hypothetical protein